MFDPRYHPPWLPLLTAVTCEHFNCDRPATDERGGVRFCFDHYLIALQWEQPRVSEEASS